MKYRQLGTTGIAVSEIGFGGWAIGGSATISGVPVGWGKTSDDQSLGAIRRARDLGVNFFDTADIYGLGRSESLMGIVLPRRRDEVVLATKVGIVRTAGGDHKRDFSKHHIFHAIDGSLKRLRTDYVDLYQVHNPTLQDLEREEIQEAMSMLQSIGKIRYWGVSVSTPEEGIEIIKRKWGYTIQVLFNILNQAPAESLFPLAMKAGYGIIARVPLASGLLTGKFRADTVFPADDIRQNFLNARRLEEVLHRVDEVKGIVGGSVRTLAGAALGFVLAHDAVSTTIPGAKNSHQVELNVAAAEEGLPEAIAAKLRDRLGDFNFYQRHAIRV